MKILACLLTLSVGVSVGHGQWLETRITLPDSLGGAVWSTCLTTDTSERYAYIGDGYLGDSTAVRAVYVVDAEAGTRVARIPSGYISAVCTNTRRNKVYAADFTRNRVLAISCATNEVVATIPTGAKPFALCYNSVDDKVCVASYAYGGSDSLTVIDCSSDSAVAMIHVGGGQQGLCYNPASNRVFCATSDTLLVIDGAGDSVVAAHAGQWWGTMVVNAVANKVYLRALVLDGTSGAVLDTLNGGGTTMCLNPRTQKLYCADDIPAWIDVFDCTADTLVARIRHIHVNEVFSMACDTIADRVYAACDASSSPQAVVLVIDGVVDSMAARIPGPYRGGLLASSRRGRMYSTDHAVPNLAVFDTGTDSVLRTIFIGGGSRLMCYDSIDDKVYCVSYGVLGEVVAIDAATNLPVGHVQVGQSPQSVTWHAPTNRVYCGGWRDITVIDPTADTVTKVLPVAGSYLCSAPGVNKVYVWCSNLGDYELAVIDCRNDSVVKTIPVPNPDALSMCYVAHDKLYIGGFNRVSIIDCVADTLVRSYSFGYSLLAPGRDGQRVYCASLVPYSLCTFDAAGDTVIADVPWDAGLSAMRYVPGLDKVYCLDDDHRRMLVADGETDSIIAQIPIPTLYGNSLGYDSTSGLVYCGHNIDSVVTFFDSRTDSMVGSESAGDVVRTFVTVPAHNRVYAGGGGNSFIPVFRTDPPGVEEALQSTPPKKPVAPTIVSRNLPLAIRQPSVLLDATGRRVPDAKPGLHSLTGCRTGVYFLRNCTDGTIVKILLVD